MDTHKRNSHYPKKKRPFKFYWIKLNDWSKKKIIQILFCNNTKYLIVNIHKTDTDSLTLHINLYIDVHFTSFHVRFNKYIKSDLVYKMLPSI
jgi:hypothetical protein